MRPTEKTLLEALQLIRTLTTPSNSRSSNLSQQQIVNNTDTFLQFVDDLMRRVPYLTEGIRCEDLYQEIQALKKHLENSFKDDFTEKLEQLLWDSFQQLSAEEKDKKLRSLLYQDFLRQSELPDPLLSDPLHLGVWAEVSEEVSHGIAP